MEQLRFIKDERGKWYVELPDYPGAKADLQMVAGADTMLDIIAEGNKEATLVVSEVDFDGAEILRLETGYREEHGDYILEKNKHETINHKMWLCPVITYVFKKLPKVIYFKSV